MQWPEKNKKMVFSDLLTSLNTIHVFTCLTPNDRIEDQFFQILKKRQ